jgi:hypothetical protein
MKTKEQSAKLEILELQTQDVHEREIYAQGIAIGRATIATGLLWLNLCKYIRQHNVSPKVVSGQLVPLGFVKTRVSEVNRVANAPDPVWNEYEGRAIGFRATLELVRNGVPTPIGMLEGISDVTSGAIEISAQVETEGESAEGSADPVEKDPEAKATESLLRASRKVFLDMATLGADSHTVRNDIYVMTVKKLPKKKTVPASK